MAEGYENNANIISQGTFSKFTLVDSSIGFNDVFDKAPLESVTAFRINIELTEPYTTNNFWGLQWKNGTGLYGEQVLFGLTTSSPIYKRTKWNNTWGQWRAMQ